MKAIFLQNADKKYAKLTVYMTRVQKRDTTIQVISKKVLGCIPSGGLIMWGVPMCFSRFSQVPDSSPVTTGAGSDQWQTNRKMNERNGLI